MAASPTVVPMTSPVTSLSAIATGTSDSPPAYTPTPDTQRGELTIQTSPIRSHRETPNQPSRRQFVTRQNSGASHLSHRHQNESDSLPSIGSLSNEGMNSYQVSQISNIPAAATQANFRNPSPPLRRSSLPLHVESTSSVPLSPTTTRDSDFARDFYAVGDFCDPLPNGSSFAADSMTSSYASSPGSPSAAQDWPSARVSSENIRDDGRPTSKPVVGHPLLKDGNTLVYPAGHECRKCEYAITSSSSSKNFDHIHPRLFQFSVAVSTVFRVTQISNDFPSY
jgi:hypothetical protein